MQTLFASQMKGCHKICALAGGGGGGGHGSGKLKEHCRLVEYNKELQLFKSVYSSPFKLRC